MDIAALLQDPAKFAAFLEKVHIEEVHSLTYSVLKEQIMRRAATRKTKRTKMKTGAAIAQIGTNFLLKKICSHLGVNCCLFLTGTVYSSQSRITSLLTYLDREFLYAFFFQPLVCVFP